MANRVIYSNLFSESRNNVVALITKTNVPDPTISASAFRKWIYSRDPDVKDSDFKGYPFIIVHPADLDIDTERGSVDRKSKFVEWILEVEIVASDRGYGKKDGKGLSHIDSISNNLVKTFMNVTNKNTLSTNAMFFSNATTSGVTTSVLDNELVYRRSIMLNFRSRIQVSA